MTETTNSFQMQQLLELLAVMSSYPDEESAARGAVERAAQALEAEVAAVIVDGRVAACVGFPAGDVPAADLVALAERRREELEVPGVGTCPTVAAWWAGTHPGCLILARWDEGFSVEERNLVRGMARVLELSLSMLRSQHLLGNMFEIQRAISRRRPLPQILDMITRAAQDLLGDEIVGLWLRDDTGSARLVAAVGLCDEVVRRQPSLPLPEAGAAGAAMLSDDIVVCSGDTSARISELTANSLRASMAAPVHDSGAVTGSLLIGSNRPGRVYTLHEVQTLRTFAEQVSLALTDANTVDRMYQAFHDSLTGLASRGLFLDRLTQRLEAAEPVALLFIDLDRFKSVNDTFGHAAGDELLTITARRLKGQLRDTDVAARLGGDEFAVLLCRVSKVADAVSVADRVLGVLGEPMRIAGRPLAVNASIGIALTAGDTTEASELMRRADIAMYQAKREGRGRLAVFKPEMLLIADAARLHRQSEHDDLDHTA